MTNSGLLIGGKFIDTPGRIREILAPYDGTVVGTASEGTWTEMDAAIDSARKAFIEWRLSSRADRQSLLRRIAELVRTNQVELVDVLTREVGKPVTWSQGEVARTAITFDLAADLLWEPPGESLPTDFDPRGIGYQCIVERFPVGPILAVTPYNWPYNLAAHKIAPALAAGNTIVLKPSPLSPLSSMALVRLVHEAGCPPGVINVIDCDGPTTERAAEDERIKLVSFTGSDKVGWMLKELIPDKKVILELGGDASVVMMPDADLDWAIPRTIAGAFGYAGQICISVQHILVHSEVYELARETLIESTKACPTGDPQLAETVCGPLINATAVDRVESWVSEAQAAGAKTLVEGIRSGNVLSPVLVEDVPFETQLGSREVFGPVVTLATFSRVEEAVSRVNASRYGIQTGVFTKDDSVADTFFRNLEVGGVVVNDYPTLRFDNMPYGGVKRSGFGREGVRYAFEEMTEPRVKLVRTASDT